MILVADSGPTKTDWALINGVEVSYFNSEGYNPYYMDVNYIQQSVFQCFPESTLRYSVLEIYFYGAGCSLERKDIVYTALAICFKNAKILVESDLLAAARCLLGNKEGFVAILGTGTNTCFYNGKEIVEIIDSLGFLVGDEGSGAHLGKQIIKAYVRGYLPNHLELLFSFTYGFSKLQLVSALYASKLPNKFAAQFAVFAGNNIQNVFIKELVASSFRDFFLGIIVHYKNYIGKEINFIGSVAFVFFEILVAVAAEFEMKVGKVNKTPLQYLVNFHMPNYSPSVNKKYLFSSHFKLIKTNNF